MASAGRRAVLAAVFVVAALVAAAPASAEISEMSLSRGSLEIKAGDGRDVISVAATKQGVVVKDRDGVSSAGRPCVGGYPESSATVTCPRRKVDVVVVDLGDGDDTFDGDGDVRFEVDGDADDDEVDGGDARDLLEGKFGDDSLDGSDGSDSLLGGLGDDKLSGKAGKDLLDGGPGSDRGNGGAGKNRCYGVEKATACS